MRPVHMPYDDGPEVTVYPIRRIAQQVTVTHRELTQRGTPMASRSRTADLRAQLSAIAEELARLEARPDEPGPGSVIKFNIQFHSGGVNYTYAAIHAGGFWYTTGQADHKRLTWDALLDWLSAHGTTEIEVLRPAARGERIQVED